MKYRLIIARLKDYIANMIEAERKSQRELKKDNSVYYYGAGVIYAYKDILKFLKAEEK